jgi:hypothetical protein
VRPPPREARPPRGSHDARTRSLEGLRHILDKKVFVFHQEDQLALKDQPFSSLAIIPDILSRQPETGRSENTK